MVRLSPPSLHHPLLLLLLLLPLLLLLLLLLLLIPLILSLAHPLPPSLQQQQDVCNDLEVPKARQHIGLRSKPLTLSDAIAYGLITTTSTAGDGVALASSTTTTTTTTEVTSASHTTTTTSTTATAGGRGEGKPAPSPQAIRRVVREMQALLGPEAHPAFTIYPSSTDIFFWWLLVGR